MCICLNMYWVIVYYSLLYVPGTEYIGSKSLIGVPGADPILR